MIVGHIGGGSVGGYQVQRSVRLRSAASAYFGKTLPNSSAATKSTLSMFVKRGQLGAYQSLFVLGGDSLNYGELYFNASDNLVLFANSGGTTLVQKTSSAVFRDVGAWYHIFCVVDTTLAVAEDRFQLWVNGTRVTSFGTNTNTWAQNSAFYFGQGATRATWIAANYSTYTDAYIAEVNFVYNQALTPTSFAEQDSTTRMWVPKKYTGSFGTNGFYLDFSDITSTTTLGYDKSGNGNNWTANNISLTSGVTYDSMLDVPGLPWADGGNGRGNYCTLNPLSNNGGTISNANLTVTTPTGSGSTFATMALPSTDKWYWEYTVTAVIASGVAFCGLSMQTIVNYVAYYGDGQKYVDGVNSNYGASYTTNDTIGVAVDVGAGTVTFYKNGTSQGAITYTVSDKTMFPYFTDGGTGSTQVTLAVNFGQRPFAYTPPTGFKALNTANLPDPTGAAAKPWEHFDTVLATGANIKTTAEAVFPSNYLEWIKDRANANNHQLIDIVRGSSAVLQSNTTAAETTYSAPSGSSVGWVWKAGGAAVSNTAGSITSQVSANTAAGFSIVTYTGTGANATVGHGLGVAPKMVIVKRRNAAGYGWPVYHSGLTSAAFFCVLNATNAQINDATAWNSTAPTSSVLSVGTNLGFNESTGTYVAYCFAEIAGFSRFGSYTGNGSADGPFVFCGFRPRYLLRKRIDAGSNWVITDGARSPDNIVNETLWADLASAEGTYDWVDFTANGFKVRESSNGMNTNTGTYIYAAFADLPLKFSNAR